MISGEKCSPLKQMNKLFEDKGTCFLEEVKNEEKSLQENLEKDENIDQKNKDICIKKRIVEEEDKNVNTEDLLKKRSKKNDEKSNDLNVNQISEYKNQTSFSSFKLLSESSISPFASLKSQNIIFPNKFSSQSTTKTFGSNIPNSDFKSLLSSSGNISDNDTHNSCEDKTGSDSTKIHKKASDEAFGMLLKKEVDNHMLYKDENIKTPLVMLEQEVKTGEEHELTIYSTRARLFVVDPETKDWRERGIGTLRVNIDQIDGRINRSRLVMRTDAVYKVILNVPLFKEMMIEGGNTNTFGSTGLDKFLKIVVMENEKPVQFAIKVKDHTIAQQLRKHILLAMPNDKPIS